MISRIMSEPTRPTGALGNLLARMNPELQPGCFVFVSLDSREIETEVLASAGCQAWINESEGPCAVLSQEEAERLGLPFESVWAWITLGVFSDLEAVGLTAAVSGSLARAGLSCNMLAGLHHDHLLVPFDAAEDALLTLERLSAIFRSE